MSALRFSEAMPKSMAKRKNLCLHCKPIDSQKFPYQSN